MDTYRLGHFFAVAKYKSFTKAAKMQRLQQPTLSRSVKSLERELGTTLIIRSTAGLKLTIEGVRLFKHCELVFDIINQTKNAVLEIKEFGGYLQFGASDSLLENPLCHVFSRYSALHPKVIPSLAVGLYQDVLSKIESGELEFGLYFAAPPKGQFLESEKLGKVRFGIYSAKGGDESEKLSIIAAREVEDSRFSSENSETLFKSISPKAKIRFSSNSYYVHRDLAANGIGMTIMPKFFAEKNRKLQQIFAGRHRSDLIIDLHLIFRKHNALSPKARAFVELFIDQCRQQNIFM